MTSAVAVADKPGGRIPALGKAFVIERGLISFDTGDPTDPHLNATASWREE